MRRFRISHLARGDLADIRRYIAQDKPRAADRQIARFFRVFQTLVNHPEAGQRYPEFAGGDLRGLTVGNYVIFYRPMESGVEIARVVSGFRDLDALFSSPDESDPNSPA